MTTGGEGQTDVLYTDVVGRLDEKSFRQIEKEVGDAGEKAGKAGGGRLSQAFGGLVAGLPALAATAAAAVGAAVVGAVAGAINLADQARQNVAEFQAQLGVSVTEAERLGSVAEQVFGDNWTGSLTEAAAAVTNVRREVQGLAENELRQVTGATVAIAETFGEEQQRVAAAVQSVMQATGLGAQEATDFITRGFQKGLNSSGDFLDTLTEYAPQFEKAKIGGGELFSLLETGAAKGALGTDKIADAFKEFGLTVVDVSDDSKAVYKELGLSQDALVKGINDGSITQAQAFEKVTNALAEVKGTADRTRIGAAIFGGAGEDFANGLTQLDLTKTSLKDLGGATDSLNARYGSFRDLFTGVWRQVQVAILPVGKELLGLANEAMPAVKDALNQVTPIVTMVVRFLVDGFRQGREAAGQFATTFGPQIERAVTTFRPAVQAIGPLFSAVFGLIRTLWETVLRPVLTAIAPLFTGVFATVGNTLNLVVRVVTGVVTAVSALLRGDLGGAVTALRGIFEDGVTFIVRQFRNLASTALGLIKNLAPEMAGAAADILRGLIRGIENGAGQVIEAARNLAGGIISGIREKLRIQSPSRVMQELGEFTAQGFVNGIASKDREVRAAATQTAQSFLAAFKELQAEKAVGKVDLSTYTKTLEDVRVKLQAQLATVKEGTPAYSAYLDALSKVTKELGSLKGKSTEAQASAKELASELAKNRADLERNISFETYTKGLRSASTAQLEHAQALARAAGDAQKYGAVKAELERREQAATAATERATQAARAQADQLAQNRKAIADGLEFDAYVAGLGSLTDAQLAAQRSAAQSAGDQAAFNAILAEQRGRAADAAQAVSDLAAAQIAAANSASQRNPQGAADSAFRQSFGSGDVGLIRSLAAVTGKSVADVRSNVQAALADAQRFAKDAATIIERVYADALTHRREVAAQQKAVDADAAATIQAQNDALYSGLDALAAGYEKDRVERAADAAAQIQSENDALYAGLDQLAGEFATEEERTTRRAVEMADERRVAIVENHRAEQAAADDAAITTQFLVGQLEELLAQGIDPRKNGFTDYLKNFVDGSGAAAEAAAYVSDHLERLISDIEKGSKAAGLVLNQPAPGVASARGTLTPAPVVTASDARGTVTTDPKATEVAARGAAVALTAEAQAWKDQTEAARESQRLREEYRQSLDGFTADQLEAVKAQALERGEMVKYQVAVEQLQALTDRPLTLTLRVAGIDTGIKALDLYKSAISGVAGVITDTFKGLVSGTEVSTTSILKSMALMALGIVKQVAVAIAAYEAQAIALAIISGASLNFVQAGLALAAAAAVAGIVAGLEARLGQSAGTATPTPSTGSSAGNGASTTGTTPTNSQVQIPTSQVTVVAAPEWMGVLSRAADKIDAAADKLVGVGNLLAREGVRVSSNVRVTGGGGLTVFDLGTP